MNPLTNVKNLQKINERELKMGLVGHEKSWHSKYKNSAWIYFGGVSFDLTEGDLLCIFSQYGEIVNINLVRDKTTGKSRGFGFLCYEDQRSTILAVDNFNGAKILNRIFRVDHVENYKPPKDSEEYDELTKLLHEKGCAPEVVAAIQNEPEEGGGSQSEESSNEDEQEKAKRKELRKEKKRAKKAKKKLKKEQKKKRKALKKLSKQKEKSDSSSSSDSRSRSSSPSSAEDTKPVVKRESIQDVSFETSQEVPKSSEATKRSEAPNKDSRATSSIEGVNIVTDRKLNIKQEPSELSTRARAPDKRTPPGGNSKYQSSRRSRSPAQKHGSRSPLQRSSFRSPISKQRRDSRSRSPVDRDRYRRPYRRSESPRDRHRSSRDDNRSRHRSPDARRR